MKTLREWFVWAEEKQVAIGHFNIATLDMLYAVIEGVDVVSKEIGVELPVVIGLAEKERAFIGTNVMAQVIHQLRLETKRSIFLNADHTYEISNVYSAIDAHFDMVIYDGAKLSHEENIKMTQDVVAYKNKVFPDCLIEAEFGFIGTGSDIKNEIPRGVSAETMTKPEDAKDFLKKTSVDLLAPSVGNIHGMIVSGNPKLNHERIREIRMSAGVPLVLHGGSGISDEDFRLAIKAGISMVHVSTELRLAYREALKTTLNATEDLAPYKYLIPAQKALAFVVSEKTRVFNSSLMK